jgi:hypothetical protein
LKQKAIEAQVLEANGGVYHLPSVKENTRFKLVDAADSQKSAVERFVTAKLDVPMLSMAAGCDPEIFAVHENGEVFPAWEYMPTEEAARKSAKEWLSTKQIEANGDVNYDPDASIGRWDSPTEHNCPLKIPAYWDGAQAEFAPWAKTCLETLHHGTRVGLQSVLNFARAKDPKAKLTLQNVVELPKPVLEQADDKFIQFRCSRSFNIYNDPGEGVQDARAYPYRCAGGHIHFGYSWGFTGAGLEQVVRGLDGILGVIGVSLAAGIDNPERRRTYGRAGEFRLPEHGLEYRVLSNFWLAHPAIAMLVFDIARIAVRFAANGLYSLCWVASEKEVREVINECDVQGARNILKRNEQVLKGLLRQTWPPVFGRGVEAVQKMQQVALSTLLNGMDVAIKDPENIEANWVLSDDAAWLKHCRGEVHSWQSLSQGVKI